MYTRFMEMNSLDRKALTGESRGPQILIGNILPMVVATIFVFARVWSRAMILKVWGIDDTFVIISWLFAMALVVANCVGVYYGLGHHQIDIPITHNDPIGIIQYSTRVFYLMGLSTTKISVCLFYLRLFPDRRSKRLVMGTMGLVVAYTVPIFFLTIFSCNPIRKNWDQSVDGKCINSLPIFYTLIVVNIAIDAWLIVLVAEKVRHLQLPRRQKVLLLLIVTMGWLVVVAALLRAVRIIAIVNEVTLGRDASWVAYDTSIWSAVEVCVGIFCVAAPTAKPLIRQCAPHLLSSMKSTFTGNVYNVTSNSRLHRLKPPKGERGQNEQAIELSSHDDLPSLLQDGTIQNGHTLGNKNMR